MECYRMKAKPPKKVKQLKVDPPYTLGLKKKPRISWPLIAWGALLSSLIALLFNWLIQIAVGDEPVAQATVEAPYDVRS